MGAEKVEGRLGVRMGVRMGGQETWSATAVRGHFFRTNKAKKGHQCSQAQPAAESVFRAKLVTLDSRVLWLQHGTLLVAKLSKPREALNGVLNLLSETPHRALSVVGKFRS